MISAGVPWQVRFAMEIRQMLNLRDAIKCITIGGGRIDMIEWQVGQKGLQSYSFHIHEPRAIPCSTCFPTSAVHLEFMPSLIAPAVKLGRKPFRRFTFDECEIWDYV